MAHQPTEIKAGLSVSGPTLRAAFLGIISLLLKGGGEGSVPGGRGPAGHMLGQ